MKRHKRHLPAANINLTSLLDITFVLLISFMIVAPAIRYQMDLTLPKVTDGKKTSTTQKPLVIEVKSGSGQKYFLNAQPVDLEEIAGKITASPEFIRDKSVQLEADKDAPWQDIAALINELKNHDIDALTIIAEHKT